MKTLKLLFSFLMVVFLISGCTYNFLVPEEVPPTDPDNPDTPDISFSADIIPIFTNNNNCTSCHSTGGQRPDLTAENAYASLNSTRYINKSTPEESMIYDYPHPDTDSHKQKKYTEAEAAKILIWINQGAEDN